MSRLTTIGAIADALPVDPVADVAAAKALARVHRKQTSRKLGTSPELERLKKAAITVADILDAGERDPTWDESQELEEAAIAYGRACRKVSK